MIKSSPNRQLLQIQREYVPKNRPSLFNLSDRGPPVTPPSPPPWEFFMEVIFEASEYGPIEFQLFTFKLLGLNMLKYAN